MNIGSNVKIRVFFDAGRDKCTTVNLTRVPCVGETVMFDDVPIPKSKIHGTIFKVIRVNHWVNIDDDGIVGDIQVEKVYTDPI